MEKLDRLRNKLKQFDDGLQELIEKIVRDNEHIILDMNTEDQLYEQGIDRQGQSIQEKSGGYAPLTIQIKRMKGQPTNRVTLRDEGDFHRSFYIEYHSDGFEIKASDWKTEELKHQWGSSILGLTDKNFQEFLTDYVKPEIESYFENL